MKSYKIVEILFYAMGIFSTFQIIEVFGANIFSWMLLLLSAVALMRYRTIKLERLNIYFILSILFSELMIIFIKVNNAREWQVQSIKTSILLIAVYVVASLCHRNKKYIIFFFKGLKISCIIQIIWCYAQLFCFKIANRSINQLIFADLLRMPNSTSQTNQLGDAVLTGLNTNAGVMAPVILMGLTLIDNTIIRLLGLIIFFISGTSTMLVCGVAYIIIWIISSRKRVTSTIKLKCLRIFFLILPIVIAFFAIDPNLIGRIASIFNELIRRLVSASSQRFTDGSTFTHTRYYTSVFAILSRENIFTVLFGNGIACGGLPFVIFFKQYTDMVYVPESDPITFLHSNGIAGATLFYSQLIRYIVRGCKIDRKYFIFLLSTVLVGIFYGVQANWVILSDLCFSFLIKEGTNIEMLEKKMRRQHYKADNLIVISRQSNAVEKSTAPQIVKKEGVSK